MVDEYQDTNRTQYELMRLLSGAHDNICVVGDEDQSIYSWRGADIRNILDFEKDFPNAKVIRLEQNYRSTKTILEAASVVISNNLERKGKWLWTDSDEGDQITLYPAQDATNEALFIADQIATLIDQGEYRAGSRLPPERDLAKQLGVSRPSVREALIAPEVEGYVEVRVGSGVYVTGGKPTPAAAPLTEDSGPFELIRARWLIEGECAALAAKSATRAQVRAIEEALAAMESDKAKGVMPLANDRLFHLRVAEASGNSALTLVVQTLWDQRTGPLFLRLEHHFDTPNLWDIAIREHREVLNAIAKHSPAAARAAMRQHMDYAARRFSASWSKSRKKGSA